MIHRETIIRFATDYVNLTIFLPFSEGMNIVLKYCLCIAINSDSLLRQRCCTT